MSLCFRSGREIVKILKSDLSSGQTQLLRFFLALLKNKIIFRSVPKCQYLSLTHRLHLFINNKMASLTRNILPGRR
jgi:hypothetical protein